jgi:DNA-binding response OmpR family regulator
MVVDDEKSICENVEKILSKNDFEVFHANSAKEALEKMAVESFSLLISDIVMPEMNGLELLKLVKKEWPLTKAVMMTAYASTDTAMKAIRLGALDYLPKPFTPDELRSTVNLALDGKLPEVSTAEEEMELIEVIDIDVPYDREEVAKQAGEEYADMLGRSDMPYVETPAPEALENYCMVGSMVCDIFKKLGATCKAGVKTETCPQLKKRAKAKAGKAGKAGIDVKTLVGVDQPFDYKEVAAAAGPDYVRYLEHDGVSVVPYEELKKNVMEMKEREIIDVDVPFDRGEVEKTAGRSYADAATRTDMPAGEIAGEALENYCETGQMVCDIFKKLGATCKGGMKTSVCPQMKKKARAAGKKRADVGKLIGVDMPFNYEEVRAATGPEYLQYLQYEGASFVPYEELKKNVMEAEQARQQPEAAIMHELMKEPAYRNILVIDDEAGVNNNIRKILAKKGYFVDQAFTKAEAIEKIESRPYKLALLDLRIPEVKGLELLETIREKRPETRVIIITGYASIETAVEGARMGAVDYLPKPFTPDEIRSAADRAFMMAA